MTSYHSNREAEFEELIQSCNHDDLWLLKGLCERGLGPYLETNNFVGERAEELAEEFYQQTRGLPKLEPTKPSNAQEADFYSASLKLYSVKGLKGRNKVTSSFCGYDGDGTEKLFDYVIIVRMDDLYQAVEILEVDWETFRRFAKRNSRDKNYKLNLTNKLRAASKILLSNEPTAAN